jgi:hypothetical protein
VAERLKRRWIGIDITHLAIALIKKRMHDTFASELSPSGIHHRLAFHNLPSWWFPSIEVPILIGITQNLTL